MEEGTFCVNNMNMDHLGSRGRKVLRYTQQSKHFFVAFKHKYTSLTDLTKSQIPKSLFVVNLNKFCLFFVFY